MRLEDFPRPRDDNGRGIHWSPTPYPPAGRALDYWVNELHALHMRWVKVVDDGRGSSVPLCRRLVAEGFMPVVRIERHRPHPRKLSRQEKEAIHRLVDAGVRYFEIDHRPDLPSAWGEGMPPNWFDVFIDAFIEDADFVLTAGGLPAIPAMVPHPDRNPVRAILQRGRKDLFERGLWWAVHAYTLNRPLEYPDEEVNRTGKPVAPEEYRAHYPWGWNEPPEVINRWRAEGAQPESTVLDDPHCFRVFEVAGEWANEALGHPIPVIITEGGAVTGWRDDRRYPRLDPWTAAEWAVRIIRFLQGEAPPWLFAVCHWLLADQRMHPARPHAWESHCWYTHYWDKQFGLQGELPVVARVKAEPSRPRDVTAPKTPPEESVFRFYKPEEPPLKEEEMARPGHIVGSVRDAERQPVVGVVVTLEADDHVVAEAKTDAEGKVRFDSVPPGVYRIHLPGHGHVEAVQVLPGEVTEFALVLRDRVSGEAVSQAAEEGSPRSPVGPVAGTGRIVGHVPGGRAGLPVRAIASDGRTWETTLGPDERFRLEGLPAGTFELVLEGIGTMVSELTLEEDEEVEVYFPMRGVIQGLVLGGTPETLVELHAQTYGWSRKVALSPQGQYRFTGLPPGSYVVRVGDRALDPVTLTGEEIQTLPPLDLRPPHRAAVRGRVRDAKGDVLPDIVVQLLRRGQVVAETRTALNGTFMFVQMPPGEYQLIVRTEPEVVRTVFLEQDRILEQDITVPSTEPMVAPIPPLPSGEVEEVAPPSPEEAGAVAWHEAEETAPPEAPEAVPQPPEDERAAVGPVPAKPFETYVLLPPPTHPLTRAVILAALPFLRRTGAVAGFRAEEAQHARRVLIVGDESVHSPAVASMLEEAGCDVDRVSADPVTLMPLFRMFLPEAGG